MKKKINILFHIPKYVDTQLSGGECTARDFAEYFNNLEGYSVRVLCDKVAVDSFNGVDLFEESDTDTPIQHLYKWASVIYTHLGKQGKAINYSRAANKPLFIYMHNNNGSVYARERKELGVIYNSYFTQRAIDKDFKGNESALIRPLLDLPQGKSAGKYVTLINLNENKGGLILRQLAEELPKVNFLGVTGGYAQQFKSQPANVKLIPPTNNMAEVYNDTALLICPSKYESYGRTAAEAIGYRVPVLYSSTNTAYEEVVGNAGEGISNREDVKSWAKGVKWMLNNLEHYRARTELQNSYLLQQIERDKDNFVKFINRFTFE